MLIILAALKAWTLWALGWAVFIYLLGYVAAWLPFNVDDTDESNFRRSGLKIYTDNLTGLQYLSTANGGLTPRLDINNKQLRKIGDDYA